VNQTKTMDLTPSSQASAALPQPSTTLSPAMPPVPSRTNQPPQIIYVQASPQPTVPLDKIVTMAVIIAVGAVTATTGLVALVKVSWKSDSSSS
jgi:hypothetical protein